MKQRTTKTRVKDAYTLQVERLRRHPENIPEEWMNGTGIFKFILSEDSFGGSCLTQIRYITTAMFENGLCYYSNAIRPLVKEIRADNRIPKRYQNITPQILPLFARYQRRADRIYKKEKEVSREN